jgi:hypothetical protein
MLRKQQTNKLTNRTQATVRRRKTRFYHVEIITVQFLGEGRSATVGQLTIFCVVVLNLSACRSSPLPQDFLVFPLKTLFSKNGSYARSWKGHLYVILVVVLPPFC